MLKVLLVLGTIRCLLVEFLLFFLGRKSSFTFAFFCIFFAFFVPDLVPLRIKLYGHTLPLVWYDSNHQLTTRCYIYILGLTAAFFIFYLFVRKFVFLYFYFLHVLPRLFMLTKNSTAKTRRCDGRRSTRRGSKRSTMWSAGA